MRKNWERVKTMENNNFRVIETQEQLDEIIQQRLSRAEKQYAKQYEGWTSPEDLEKLLGTHKQEIENLNTAHAKELEKFNDVTAQLEEKDKQLHQYAVGTVKNSVARELNLPYEAVEFLQGENEQEIRESAERLSKLSTVNHYKDLAPTKDREGDKEDSYKSALKEALSNLTSQN